MKNLLTEALTILGNTEVNDTRHKARGRRAQARVLAMISVADATARMYREQRIANLLVLAQMEKDYADWALSEARRLLSADKPGDPPAPPDKS
ncbi:hypothetical protein GCM10010977_08470 [Citricoccus zhacaiensis]|uniref:Uncharacterized protein n=1 Tax=Citricoccus zhacaiensis TaxID=489142 RepID=A0ABQ2LS93_9MICC|nr:hypothetical protein [Citricoccus zhacaiensis]GGO42502.1 hypothetical protein GCM10010977_08470 [Citricoccus zhacaiensis]